MDKFPFTKDEWDEIINISHDMVNEVYRYDNISPELFSKFLTTIKRLENKYGKHPKLSETLADHTDDKDERKKLYTEALELAISNDLPTITIRIAFARLLIDEIKNTDMALNILKADKKELENHDDEINVDEYYELKRSLTIKACN